MIFVDTSGWYALASKSDAIAWQRENLLPLVTTDYIIDETLTLLAARRLKGVAVELGESFFNGGLSAIYFITPEDITSAWQVFRTFEDKAWSFTDCTSYVVMRRLGVDKALSFDEHFRQFGTVNVFP